jgi:hypothetical protein
MTSWCGWLCFSKQIRARISLCRTSPTFPFRDSSGGGQPLGCPRDFSAMFPRNPNGYPREAFPGWIKRRSLEGADDDHHQRVGQGGEQARSAGSATPRPTRWVLRSYTSMSRSCCHNQKGGIPHPPNIAIPLIRWRLRSIDEPQSRVIMENLPT